MTHRWLHIKYFRVTTNEGFIRLKVCITHSIDVEEKIYLFSEDSAN